MKKSIEIGLFDLIPGIRLFGSLLKKLQICFVDLKLINTEKIDMFLYCGVDLFCSENFDMFLSLVEFEIDQRS